MEVTTPVTEAPLRPCDAIRRVARRGLTHVPLAEALGRSGLSPQGLLDRGIATDDHGRVELCALATDDEVAWGDEIEVIGTGRI